MSDDIEQRLTAAAQAVRQLDVTRQQCSDLQAREDQLRTDLATLQSQYRVEQKEVGRLEHLSLARVMSSLHGSRDEALAREQAEAAAARLRVADAQARLEAVRQENQAAREQCDRLSSAPETYAAVLAEKEQHLTESDDPRRATLLGLADKRGRLNAEVAEMAKATSAADAAQRALEAADEKLDSASGWNAYDTYFGGGIMASAIEHSRLDEAAQAAADADQRMAVLRTELTDLDDMAQTAPLVAISGATKFVDMWFDNIFTDLAVRDRIKQAQQNVARSLQLVSAVKDRLATQSAEAQARLSEIEVQRRELLTQ